jgi:radical SAM protein with 4Fe4S-binding SPASM domain
LGTRFINLAGGESLIRKDIEDLVAYTKSKGISPVITTNGHLANVKRIKALYDAGLSSLTWSLDTLDPELYEFIRGVPLKPTLRNLIEILKRKEAFPNMSVGINCVVSRLNIDTIKDLVRFLNDNNSFIQFQIIHPTWYSQLDKAGEYQNLATFKKSDENKLRQFIDDIIEMKIEGYNICNNDAYLRGFVDFAIHTRMPEHFHCLAGYDSISINVHMKTYTCGQVSIVGDLRKDKLEDLWFSKAWQEHRNKMWNLECQGCWILCHAEGVPDDYKYSTH